MRSIALSSNNSGNINPSYSCSISFNEQTEYGLLELKARYDATCVIYHAKANDTPRLVKMKADFTLGKQQADNLEYQWINALTIREKLVLFFRTGDISGIPTIGQMGALSKKIDTDWLAAIEKERITKSVRWLTNIKNFSGKSIEELGQFSYLGNKLCGMSFPLTILMSCALEQGSASVFAERLRALKNEHNIDESLLYQQLCEMHENSFSENKTILTNAIKKTQNPQYKDGKSRNLETQAMLEEHDVFLTDSVQMKTIDYAMSISRVLKPDGVYYHYFFEPNYGIVCFSDHKKMMYFIKDHLSSRGLGSRYSGGVGLISLKFVYLECNKIKDITFKGQSINYISRLSNFNKNSSHSFNHLIP